MLSQFAEESEQQAKQLAAMTANRATIMNIDPESYRLMLSQRWRAERQQALILHHMKVLQHVMTSLTPTPTSTTMASDAETALLTGGHEGKQAPGPERKAYTNLVSFLCCPQRVAPLHRRSHSRFFKVYLRPLYLSVPATATTIASPLTTTMNDTATRTASSTDSSLDMHVETPVVMDSLAEQQAQFKLMIDDGQAGTAIILTRPLPSPVPLDPSDIEIELPDYVHELLTDFETQGNAFPSAATAIKFQADDSSSNDARSGGLWPFKMRYKDRGPRNATSQPELRSKSSLKRLSGFLSASDLLALRRKANLKEDGLGTTLTTVSEAGSGDDVGSPTRSRASSTKVIGKVASKIGRRISFANPKQGA